MMKNYKIIYECISGSRAYGTELETSDVDIRGVYVQDNMEILLGHYQPTMKREGDVVYYEIRHFLDLLEKGSLPIVEMLFIDDRFILQKDVIFNTILNKRLHFLFSRVTLKSIIGMLHHFHKSIQNGKHASHLYRLVAYVNSFLVRKPINVKVDQPEFHKFLKSQSETPTANIITLEHVYNFNCGLAERLLKDMTVDRLGCDFTDKLLIPFREWNQI